MVDTPPTLLEKHLVSPIEPSAFLCYNQLVGEDAKEIPVEFDITMLEALSALVVATLAAIQAYRSGITKNKRLEAETVQSVHDMIAGDADRYYHRVKQCEDELIACRALNRKWGIAFRIRGLELRIARQRPLVIDTDDLDSGANYSTVDYNYVLDNDTTYSDLEAIFHSISNPR